MKAIILAAGYATRLYPLTKDQPKPLLEVGGRAIIDYILDQVFSIDDIDQVFVVTNEKFSPHFEKWAQSHPKREQLVVVNDGTTSNEDRLGAIGDIHFVIDQKNLDDDLLVVAGDNLFDLSLPNFLAFSREKDAPAICSKDLSDKRELLPKYGVVALDDDKKVLEFQEKPEEPKSDYIAIGIYYFPKRHLPLFSKYLGQGQVSDAPGYFIQWLHQELPVYAFVFRGDWYDIGDHDSLKEADEVYRNKNER